MSDTQTKARVQTPPPLILNSTQLAYYKKQFQQRYGEALELKDHRIAAIVARHVSPDQFGTDADISGIVNDMCEEEYGHVKE